MDRYVTLFWHVCHRLVHMRTRSQINPRREHLRRKHPNLNHRHRNIVPMQPSLPCCSTSTKRLYAIHLHHCRGVGDMLKTTKYPYPDAFCREGWVTVVFTDVTLARSSANNSDDFATWDYILNTYIPPAEGMHVLSFSKITSRLSTLNGFAGTTYELQVCIARTGPRTNRIKMGIGISLQWSTLCGKNAASNMTAKEWLRRPRIYTVLLYFKAKVYSVYIPKILIHKINYWRWS